MRIRTITILTVAAVSLALSGCVTGGGSTGASAASGSSSDLPEWYLNPQAVYPDDIYLTAIGTGDSRRDAEQQALAGLSQIFEADISVDVRTSERYSELMTAGGNVSESEVQLAQNTNVRSNQTLLNVQYGEAAVDDVGRVNVIAYIERLPTGRVYTDLIARNATQVERFLAESAASTDLIREYAFLSAAAVVATGNELLRDQLRIISPPMSRMVNLPYDYDTVLQQRADLASQMRVSVSIEGDQDGRIAGIIRQSLSEERFPVGDDSPVLRVTGQIVLGAPEETSNFISRRWSLTLDMSGPDGASLVTVDTSNRASGVSESAATAFAYRDAEEAVRDEFVAAIGGYFDGVVLGN